MGVLDKFSFKKINQRKKQENLMSLNNQTSIKEDK